MTITCLIFILAEQHFVLRHAMAYTFYACNDEAVYTAHAELNIKDCGLL